MDNDCANGVVIDGVIVSSYWRCSHELILYHLVLRDTTDAVMAKALTYRIWENSREIFWCGILPLVTQRPQIVNIFSMSKDLAMCCHIHPFFL